LTVLDYARLLIILLLMKRLHQSSYFRAGDMVGVLDAVVNAHSSKLPLIEVAGLPPLRESFLDTCRELHTFDVCCVFSLISLVVRPRTDDTPTHIMRCQFYRQHFRGLRDLTNFVFSGHAVVLCQTRASC